MGNRIINQIMLAETFKTNRVLVVQTIEPFAIDIYLDCPDDMSKNEFLKTVANTISAHVLYNVKPYDDEKCENYKAKTEELPNVVKHFALECSGNLESVRRCIGEVFGFYGYKVSDISVTDDKLLIIKMPDKASDEEIYRLTLYANELSPLGIVALIK